MVCVFSALDGANQLEWLLLWPNVSKQFIGQLCTIKQSKG